TVRDLVMNTAGGVSGGQQLKAIAPSGPSGGFLPAVMKFDHLPKKFIDNQKLAPAKTYDILDLPLDLGSLGDLGSMLGAAVVVYGDRADMVEQALNCVEFYRNESCGKCVPCRMGSQKLVEIITDILQKRCLRENLTAVNELAEAMTLTSICGLGQVAANPIATVLKYFRDDLEAYFK